MRTEIADEKALRKVPPSALLAYALASGWAVAETFGKHSQIYAKPGHPELIIPRTDKISDYASVVRSIINTISNLENRDQISIYRDLLQVDSDIIRLRAPKAKRDGSISVDAGVAMFHNAREMLLSAACAAREPRRVYRLGSHREALDYLDAVRFGQTEQGSFVVTLVSPVPPPEQPTQFEELLGIAPAEEPFQRSVTKMLMRSLVEAHKATKRAARAGMTAAFDRAVSTGVNANLCDAVAALIEQGQGLDVAVAWSKLLPEPEERAQVKFSAGEASVLREAADHLRNSDTGGAATLDGFVRALGRDQDATQGTITVKAVVDGKLASVKALLAGSMYADAIEAHRSRRTISVSGILTRQGQRWHLEEVQNLRIHEDFEDLF